jgi:histidine ammonia-lyase
MDLGVVAGTLLSQFSGSCDTSISSTGRRHSVLFRRLVMKPPAIVLDGMSLTCRDISRLGSRKYDISICNLAMDRIVKARQVVDRLVSRGSVAYGINTGFGLFSDVVIEKQKLSILQTNLIRSHSAGVGIPLSPAETRRLLALRINVLAKGHSGIRRETVEKMVKAFNANCLSVVPSQGTVGASGDLAPLSHLALGLMGEGMMWDPDIPDKQSPSNEVLQRKGIEPIRLEAKEGLAMINGTQMMTSITAEATVRAASLAVTADVACALSIEALKGTPSAFEPCIHATRPHQGQVGVAKRLLRLLLPTSEIFNSHRYEGKVQDAYSMRCAPQVHGIAHDTIAFVESLLDVEINSATDNPMVVDEDHEVPLVVPQHSSGESKSSLRDAEPRDGKFKTHKRNSDTFYAAPGGFVISGGNFHGT